jgi:predicted nuclease with TOPRIM domain
MDQIKKKVARQKEEKGVEVSAEPVPDIQFSFEASPSQEPPGLKKRVKAKLVKMLRPLFPFLRVLALPVHEDLMKVVASLHETNRRIDQLDQRCTQINNTLGEKIGEVSSDLNAALSTLGEELRAELGNLSQTLFQMRADLYKAMDYVKLLHNLDHNLVVELTKLRVEYDTLKSRVRIMEKDFEHLGRREKALEGEIFK